MYLRLVQFGFWTSIGVDSRETTVLRIGEVSRLKLSPNRAKGLGPGPPYRIPSHHLFPHPAAAGGKQGLGMPCASPEAGVWFQGAGAGTEGSIPIHLSHAGCQMQSLQECTWQWNRDCQEARNKKGKQREEKAGRWWWRPAAPQGLGKQPGQRSKAWPGLPRVLRDC